MINKTTFISKYEKCNARLILIHKHIDQLASLIYMLSILPFHLHLFTYLFVYIVNSIVSFLPKNENWQLIKAGKSEALNAATARKE